MQSSTSFHSSNTPKSRQSVYSKLYLVNPLTYHAILSKLTDVEKLDIEKLNKETFFDPDNPAVVPDQLPSEPDVVTGEESNKNMIPITQDTLPEPEVPVPDNPAPEMASTMAEPAEEPPEPVSEVSQEPQPPPAPNPLPSIPAPTAPALTVANKPVVHIPAQVVPGPPKRVGKDGHKMPHTVTLRQNPATLVTPTSATQMIPASGATLTDPVPAPTLPSTPTPPLATKQNKTKKKTNKKKNSKFPCPVEGCQEVFNVAFQRYAHVTTKHANHPVSQTYILEKTAREAAARRRMQEQRRVTKPTIPEAASGSPRRLRASTLANSERSRVTAGGKRNNKQRQDDAQQVATARKISKQVGAKRKSIDPITVRASKIKKPLFTNKKSKLYDDIE